MYDFNEKLAKLAVRYALDVQPEDLVSIEGSEVANDLMREMYIECVKVGAYPVVHSAIKGIGVAHLKLGNDNQLMHISPVMKTVLNQYHKRIQISADYNRQKLTLIPPEKTNMVQKNPEFPELIQIYQERIAKKEMKWVIVPYPCDAMAQEAKMDTQSYTEFVYKALKLDQDDPAAYWRNIEREQENKVQYLNNVESIHVLGEDTDLTLSVKGRPWENCCGHENLPDGEIFTSPVEDSVNGYIRFTFPGIYQGKEVENIYLGFKNGKVVKATAEKGQELLETILKIDNADVLGEFAVGTNFGITQFTKNMLFDEKMGGTMHCALGMGFPETKSENLQCAIHWDILKDMKPPGSKIIADGKVIYEEGKWLI
ncbi:MAG: aminopeptidase [Candidatus Lokiarchaeota archaeon]|nr:aminopeptidase [Candidatus Lokiarchaeota archaeon]